RADNGIPGEENEGLDRIGRLLPDGRLTGYFAADPGRTIEVDHLLGASMSFRRSALEAIGGIRGNYPGTCLCEESDISLRLRATGGRLLYTPRAVVRHMAAPYGIGGKRFDRRYLYYARRNHLVMLVRNFGWRDPVVRRYARSTVRDQREYLRTTVRRLGPTKSDGTRRPLRKRLTAPVVLTRAGAELVGLAAGVPAAVRAARPDRAAGRATPRPRVRAARSSTRPHRPTTSPRAPAAPSRPWWTGSPATDRRAPRGRASSSHAGHIPTTTRARTSSSTRSGTPAGRTGTSTRRWPGSARPGWRRGARSPPSSPTRTAGGRRSCSPTTRPPSSRWWTRGTSPCSTRTTRCCGPTRAVRRGAPSPGPGSWCA